MEKFYILMRRINDFDWEEPTVTRLVCSSNEELLEKIAEERNEKHKNDEHAFEYWVIEVEDLVLIESEEDFYETYREEIFDYWEEK